MTEATTNPTARNPDSSQRLRTAAWALPALIATLATIILIEIRWSSDISFAITLLLVTAVSVVFAYETLMLGAGCMWTRRQCLRRAVPIGLIPLALGAIVPLLESTSVFEGQTEGSARRSVLILLAVPPVIALVACLILGVVQRDGNAARMRLSIAFALYGALALATVPLAGRIGFFGILPFTCVMLIVMVSDSVAYFVGRRWGKRKLAPRLSPKKTWEGFIAGMLSAGLILPILLLPAVAWISDSLIAFGDPLGRGDLSSNLFWTSVLIISVLLVPVGMVVGVVGTFGDLFASWFKRRVDAKDSGTLFPGHGGLLDRTDSLLPNFVLVPVVLSYHVEIGLIP